jgi:hypothetical protein
MSPADVVIGRLRACGTADSFGSTTDLPQYSWSLPRIAATLNNC